MQYWGRCHGGRRQPFERVLGVAADLRHQRQHQSPGRAEHDHGLAPDQRAHLPPREPVYHHHRAGRHVGRVRAPEALLGLHASLFLPGLHQWPEGVRPLGQRGQGAGCAGLVGPAPVHHLLFLFHAHQPADGPGCADHSHRRDRADLSAQRPATLDARACAAQDLGRRGRGRELPRAGGSAADVHDHVVRRRDAADRVPYDVGGGGAGAAAKRAPDEHDGALDARGAVVRVAGAARRDARGYVLLPGHARVRLLPRAAPRRGRGDRLC
mmetsp:Transcript_56876/g.133362  ORF Transcript_56876/g.133362 Transcript_56876/m.133362 type:complete len:268 (+) Transcript_56876:422-1225(+)